MAADKAQWSEWMLKAQSGDEKAYHQLLTAVNQTLRGFLKKRISDAQAVEDVLQEVLIGIHRARHTFDPKRSFTAWMYAIARYKMIDYFRKTKRDASLIFIDDMGAQGFEMEIYHEEGLIGEFQKLVKQLPLKQQEVLVSMKFEGLSVKETASKLKMSESAVKVTAHRAFQTLKKKWGILEY